jgi:tight adherence protein C
MVLLLFAIKLSYSKYSEFILPLDKKSYPLKTLIPVGLIIIDLLRIKTSGMLNRQLIIKISELYGTQNAAYYSKIYYANIIVYMLAGILLIMIAGSFTGTDIEFWVFSVLLIAGIYYSSEREIDKRLNNRRTEIRLGFPDFLNSLTLLVNAGLTVVRAWEKVSSNKQDDNNALYRELNLVISEINSGIPESKAYENFAKRCRTPEITRSVSVILQNLRKGSSEIVSVLRVQANECWEMRKSVAKKLGEEASSKLLFPMMLIFISILLIVLTPAVLSLRQVLN